MKVIPVKALWPLLLIPAFASAMACSSFLHWSDPNVQVVSCAITSALLPEIESLAVTLGVPPAVAIDLFTGACSTAAAKGATQKEAEEAGFAPMRLAARAKLEREAK